MKNTFINHSIAESVVSDFLGKKINLPTYTKSQVESEPLPEPKPEPDMSTDGDRSDTDDDME